MDVYNVVVWFSIRLVCFVVEIKSYVQKIYNAFITIDYNFEIVLSKYLLYIFFDSLKLWSTTVAENGKSVIAIQANVLFVVFFRDDVQ